MNNQSPSLRKDEKEKQKDFVPFPLPQKKNKKNLNNLLILKFSRQ